MRKKLDRSWCQDSQSVFSGSKHQTRLFLHLAASFASSNGFFFKPLSNCHRRTYWRWWYIYILGILKLAGLDPQIDIGPVFSCKIHHCLNHLW